jgi:hypothetical protein
MEEAVVQRALSRHGVIDLADLGASPQRAARRAGLVVVQPGAAVAATQPLGPLQHVFAAALAAEEPFAFLSDTALWAHGQGPEPALVEVGVVLTRGLTLWSPVVARRVSAQTLAGAVVRRTLPVVALEVAVVQRCRRLGDRQALQLVERVLRARATTPDRLRAACRRGLEGSRAVRAALLAVGGGDLELQKRRLRAALTAAGVVGLRSEVHLVSAAGASCYLDLLHEASRRALELDGAYHDLPGQRRVDRRRDRWVRREHGIEVIRVADEEVRHDLPALVRELVPQLRAPARVA